MPNEIREGIPFITRPIHGMAEDNELSKIEQREVAFARRRTIDNIVK